MEILAAWLLADLLTGFVHWAEDILLLKETRFKFLNSIKADNDLHHANPTAMTKFTIWQNINTSVVFAWPLAGILILVGAPLWLWLAVVFGSFGNAIHRFAHMNPRQIPRVIRYLQNVGIFISPNHHNGHHFHMGKVLKKEETVRRYCPMTNWMNPLVDGFFKLIAALLAVVFISGCAHKEIEGTGYTGKIILEQCCLAYEVADYYCPCATL